MASVFLLASQAEHKGPPPIESHWTCVQGAHLRHGGDRELLQGGKIKIGELGARGSRWGSWELSCEPEVVAPGFVQGFLLGCG